MDEAGRATRRTFLSSIGLTTAALATAGSRPMPAHATPTSRPANTAPNILLIQADDLGFGELGSYGQRRNRTPRLDRLAAEGTRFTGCYAGGPVCAPSRCSLLTGMHAGHGTVRENPAGDVTRSSLRPEDVTFGEIMRSVGYETACIGKWGFGDEVADQPSHPNRRGFGEFFGYVTHTHAHDYYPTYLFDDGDRVTYPENQGADVTYAPEVFVDRALEFVSRDRQQPFLLYYNPNLPHAPHDVPSRDPYEDRPWPAGGKGHAAQVTLLDTHVGRLVDRLVALGIAANTVVLFVGDNGPHEEGGQGYDPDFFDVNGPLRGYKRNLYEGGIRVPAIAWSPGLLPAGTVSTAPWAFWDVLPTLADFAGAPVPDHLDGRSVRDLFTGGDLAPVPLYFYRRDRDALPLADAVDGGRVLNLCEAVRDGRWKAVRFAPGRDRYVDDGQWTVELYDLDGDAGETTDVVARFPDVAARLVGFLRQSWVDAPYHRPTWSPYGLAIDATPFLVAGTAREVQTVLTNHRSAAFTDVRVAVSAPAGWSVAPLSPPTFDAVRPGESVRIVWSVTPPADAAADVDGHELTVRASFGYAGGPDGTELADLVTVAPPAPVADAFLSDLQWFSALNGHGPVERNLSNGPDGAGDGAPIRIRGRTYAKGLGVHGESDIRFHLGGACDRFIADVGLDDWSAERSDVGSVAFHVFADGRQVFDSGVLTEADAAVPVNLSVTGVEVLRLVVTNAVNTAFDHASWAAARVTAAR